MASKHRSKPKGFKVRKAGHLVVRVTDPAATAAFFQEVIGFGRKGVLQRGMHFLTSDFDDNHHMLLVRPAKPGATAQDARSAVGMAGVSYQFTDAAAFDRAIDRLCARGLSPLVDEAEGKRSLRFRDPDGMPFEFWCQAQEGHEMSNPLLRTTRVTFRAADLARSVAFYEDVFGFDQLGRDGEGRTLMGADGTVMLALEQATDSGAARPRVEPEPFIGMEHFAFELEPDTFEALRAFYRHIKALNVEIHHCVDHIITNSIYFLDPDRNLIEGYINCPRERFRDMEHPYGSLEALDAALEGKCEPSWMAAFAAEK